MLDFRASEKMPTTLTTPLALKTAEHRESDGFRTDAWLIAAAVVLWLICAAAFGLPGRTLDWGRDLFMFFGQINALEHGQVPYRDFRTSLGALPFYLPWFGYRLVGGFAGALEIGGLLATALLLPCMVVALRTRFGLPKALLLLLCLVAMAAAPVDHGPLLPSHIGFYNRWCHSALATLFLFAVPTRRQGNSRIEGAAVAALLLFLFFVKASYFAVGLVLVAGFGLALEMFRRTAMIGIGAFATVVFGTQVSTGVIDDYLTELAHSLNVSGVSWYMRDEFLLDHLPSSLGHYALVAVAGVFAVVSKAKLRWRQWVFVLFALFGCLAVQGHNGSSHGPLPLVAALALLGERSAGSWRRWHLCLLTLFMLPYLAAATRIAFDYRDDVAASPAALPRMADVYVAELSCVGAPRHYLWHCLGFVADELRPGLRLLRNNGVGDGVLALDYYNWFPVFLDAPPLRGRLTSLHVGRTIDRDTAPAPDAMFRHAEYVMVPRQHTEDRQLLLTLYRHHLQVKYLLLDSNDTWQLWKRNRR